jgi:hypothetical protein
MAASRSDEHGWQWVSYVLVLLGDAGQAGQAGRRPVLDRNS